MSEIQIYGDIGVDVTAREFKRELELADRGERLIVRIDSQGGSVFEGFSIYDALANYDGPKKCVIESAAFSIAAMIPLACEEIEITANGYFMIHNPMVNLSGADHNALASSLEMVVKIRENYVRAVSERTGQDSEEVSKAMDRETFYSATEAVRMGLASRVIDSRIESRVLASAKHNLPREVVTSLRGRPSVTLPLARGDSAMSEDQTQSQAPRPATVQEIRASFPKARAEFVLDCLERQLPLASVATAAAEDLTAENEKLRSELKETKAELEEMKAKLVAMEEGKESPSMMEDKEEYRHPVQRGGAEPVGRVRRGSGVESARARWEKAIREAQDRTHDRKQAVILANRSNPGLREEMLKELGAAS